MKVSTKSNTKNSLWICGFQSFKFDLYST